MEARRDKISWFEWQKAVAESHVAAWKACRETGNGKSAFLLRREIIIGKAREETGVLLTVNIAGKISCSRRQEEENGSRMRTRCKKRRQNALCKLPELIGLSDLHFAGGKVTRETSYPIDLLYTSVDGWKKEREKEREREREIGG